MMQRSIQSIKDYINKHVRDRDDWAITIYQGTSPCHLAPDPTLRHPILTSKDVTDARADFIADPFMVKENGIWYMFFEVLNLDTNRGDIAFATSHDAKQWTYQKIIIAEPFHLSYPYTFKWNDEYYLILESSETNSVRLYQATNFPAQWSFVKNLIEGRDFVDPSIFFYDDMWWLLATTVSSENLYLYYAESLMGEWVEHPQSPVVRNNRQIARPGGRVTIFNDKVIRYTQDCEVFYGSQVRAFAITNLTTTTYQEQEVEQTPIIGASGSGWNKRGMHTVDPHQIGEDKWIACVDGYRRRLVIAGIAI